jgi:integrase
VGAVVNKDNTGNITVAFKYDPLFVEKVKTIPANNVHTFRHCFATHLLESGVEICRIKQLMGHTHIQATTFYLHLLNFDGSVKSPLDTLPKKRGRKPKKVKGNA